MKISGFQKLTLLDYPGVMACIVFTQGCNLRCPFCHNWPLVINNDSKESISEDEIFDYLKLRKGIIEGICISGGEPLLQPDIIGFLKRLRSLNVKIKIDTNGTIPKVLKEIIDQHLADYIAMDIKNVFDKYEKTIGTKIDISKIKESIKLIQESNIDHEFRTTVISEYHDIKDLIKIAEYIYGSKYYIQNFVLSENVIDQNLHDFKVSELEKILKKLKEKNPLVSLR